MDQAGRNASKQRPLESRHALCPRGDHRCVDGRGRVQDGSPCLAAVCYAERLRLEAGRLGETDAIGGRLLGSLQFELVELLRRVSQSAR